MMEEDVHRMLCISLEGVLGDISDPSLQIIFLGLGELPTRPFPEVLT